MLFNIITITWVIHGCRRNIRKFLLPGNIFFLYSAITFFLGEIWFLNGWILDVKYLQRFQNIGSFPSEILGFLLLSTYFIYKLLPTFSWNFGNLSSSKRLFIFGLGPIYFLLPLISMLLEAFGFFGSIHIYFYVYVFTFLLSHKLVKIKNKTVRYISILALFIAGLPLFYASKRDLIFLVLPLMVYLLPSKKLHWRLVTRGILSAIVLIIFIIAMSIFRGYGNYNVSGLLDVIKFIPDYISSESFYSFLGRNIEVVYSYFHTVNGVFGWLNGELQTFYGLTLLKVFFVPIPSGIIAGPDSIIDIYTTYWSPSYRASGGSYPINMLGEYILNFGYLSCIMLGLFLKFLDLIMLSWIRSRKESVFMGILFMNLLVLFRGSGLDLFVAGLVVYFVIYIIHYLLSLLIHDLYISK